MFIEPEAVVSVWITVVGDGVTQAFILLDTVVLSDVFVMVTDGLSSEVPLGCDDLLL